MQLVGGTFVTAEKNSLAPETSPVLFGGVRNSESPVFFEDQKF